MYTIRYGKEHFDFDVLFVERKTLEIAVNPDMSVIVKAPLNIEMDAVKTRVVKRARWILKQRNYFRQFSPRTPERQYLGGETHLYLGRQYRLKIEASQHNQVKLIRGYFQVQATDPRNIETVQSILEKWYRQRAHDVFQESFKRCWSSFKNESFDLPSLTIRKMGTRWGSLSKNRTLTLNFDLIRAPRECIEYVITHELCHLKYHDHSANFYLLLDKVMPDWAKRKHKLEMALV